MLLHTIRLAVSFIIVLLITSCNVSDSAKSAKRYTVKPAHIITMTESGQLGSVNNTFITSPGNWNMEYRISRMSAEGSFVQKGDTVVTFSTDKAQSELDQALAQLEIQQEKYKEVVKANEISLNSKKNTIRQLELQYQINENRVEQARFESDTRLKEAQLELQKTKLSQTKAQTDLSALKIINQKKADLVMLEIRQAKVKIQRAKNKLNDMFLISPKSGMVIYQRQGWRGNGEKVKVGDSVYPRTRIMAIPDLQAIQVTVKLNEVDRPYVREGNTVHVRVEAYPDTLFKGSVYSISKIVEKEDGANNLKTYNMDIHLQQGKNYRLKPGLSAIATIEVDSVENMFEIPSWCLKKETNGYFVDEINSGRISVKLHMLRDGKAFIKGALQENMQLRAIF